MKRKIIVLFIFLAQAFFVFGQIDSTVQAPKFSTVQTHSLTSLEKSLSVAPVALFFIILIGLVGLAKKKGFYMFIKLLAEDEIPQAYNIAASTEETSKADGATVSTPINQPKMSSSRFIALVAGLTTVGLACIFASFYFYKYLTTGREPSTDGFTNTLLTLGLGVIPYSVNKITSIFHS